MKEIGYFSVLSFRTIYFADMRIKFLPLLLIVFASAFRSEAQNSIVQEGEFGVGIGGAHYFGDLNTRARLNRIKPAATIFFRKNFGNYISARIGASFAQ